MSKEKIILECNLRSLEGFEKDKASLQALSIPEESKRQPDLLYMVDIMVSTGANLNGAYFYPSEIVKAQHSIPLKAVDILHNEDQVVGHITGYAFLDKKGNPLDIYGLMEKTGSEFDKQQFDVATSSVIYKFRFPEVADKIEQKQFKVSMECYYGGLDIKVGDLVISVEEAKKFGLVELVGGKVKVVDGRRADVVPVNRVLRDIHFSGKGLVDKPANPESLILEAASMKPMNFENAEIPVINLMEIESYRKMKQENEKITISTVKESSECSDSPVVTVFRPEHENTCVSYERYVYATPGEDEGDDSMPTRSPVARENYCKLFDLDCPVHGMSSDYACWRNVFNRTGKEEVRNEIDALMKLRQDLNLAPDGMPMDGMSNMDNMDMMGENSKLHEGICSEISKLITSLEKADEYLKKV